MRVLLSTIQTWPAYTVALLFFAFYPIFSSLMWVTAALTYYVKRERNDRRAQDLTTQPLVSIVIPCYCEEIHVARTIEACLRLNYPSFEIVVVDDASSDRSVEMIKPFVEMGQVRLVAKQQNEGKAMALNDAIPVLNGEIVVIMDADAHPDPQMLTHLIPHFSSARVGAVTGNPRVLNRDTLASKLQMIEFTSIVSLQRRAQRVWGRILTVSGVVTAFRRTALIDVGLFSPEMATEDIDITWKLQKKFYDVRYEPKAIVWMRVPKSFGALWRQRRRWATGLSQVLRRHGSDVLFDWRMRRMWPVLFESTLSIIWAHLFVVLTGLWMMSYAVGLSPVGASPIPNWWGMTIATMSLGQLAVGVLLDKRYDSAVLKYFPVAVFYPIVYWMMMALTTVVSTPRGLLVKSRQPTRWRTLRHAEGI